MEKKHKDALRYVILLLVTFVTAYIILEITGYAYSVDTLTTQHASMLGAISTALLGAWGAVVKWFFHTKVGG